MAELNIFWKNSLDDYQAYCSDFISSSSGTVEEIFSNTSDYCPKSLMISYEKIMSSISNCGQKLVSEFSSQF